MADMQFLVTMSSQLGERLGPDKMANRIAGILLACPEVCCAGMVERTMSVVPLPDLGADDSDLQTGFRRLAATLRKLDQMNTVCIYSEPVELSRGQITALLAELSKQHPARTCHVDHAALDAVRAIRTSDRGSDRQVQKDARAQLIIIDAICRCVPEEGK